MLQHNHLSEIPAGIQRLKRLRRLNLVANQLESVPEEIGKLKSLQAMMLDDNQLESELYTSLPKTRFGMTIFPDTRHVAEPSVPLCSHTMGDAERFKTTNNMYSIFSVPDHQNAQAEDTMRKHATREFKVERIRARQRDFEERCWAANEAAQQYDEMKVARKAMNLLNYERIFFALLVAMASCLAAFLAPDRLQNSPQFWRSTMTPRRQRRALALVVIGAIAQLLLAPAFVSGRLPTSSNFFALRSKAEAEQTSKTARRLFGLGTSELLVILGAAILFFGPDALKSVAKEAGKAAGDLKEVPKAFEEGMSETDKTKKTEAEELRFDKTGDSPILC
eukprot:g28339.t1